jgi:hypothetical protein
MDHLFNLFFLFALIVLVCGIYHLHNLVQDEQITDLNPTAASGFDIDLITKPSAQTLLHQN